MSYLVKKMWRELTFFGSKFRLVLRMTRAFLGGRYFLYFYYGERLRDYPTKVACKMLFSRLVFVLHLPILLPDKHFLMNHYGAKMYMRLKSSPIMVDVAFGVYEYWKTKLFTSLVKEGMTIIDIGAAKGFHSLLFANLMHDKGKVLAFEPEPAQCYWFSKNVEANNYKCIELHQFALSDKEGSATFHTGGGMGSLVPRPAWEAALQGEAITVQTRTLDSVLEEEHIREVHIIKMDVQGSDLLVLKGAKHTLEGNNVRLLMDIDVYSNEEREELFELLNSLGFDIYRIGPKLKPIMKAEELFLFPNHETGEGLKRARTKAHQMVKEIYAVKPE